MLSMSGAQEHRRWLPSAGRTSQPCDYVSEHQIPSLRDKKPDRIDRSPLAAGDFELAIRPVRKMVGWKEGWRVHAANLISEQNENNGASFWQPAYIAVWGNARATPAAIWSGETKSVEPCSNSKTAASSFERFPAFCTFN
jgi:hypothetical protein